MNEKIELLLEKIFKQLLILNQKEVIPQIDSKKNLSFLLDLVDTRWTSFSPIHPNNTRLFGYYYSSAPLQLTNIEEGWIPLSVDIDGKLRVNTT